MEVMSDTFAVTDSTKLEKRSEKTYKMYLPPDYFNKRNPYMIIAVVRGGTLAALDEELDDEDDVEFGKEKKKRKKKTTTSEVTEECGEVSSQSGGSIWKEWSKNRAPSDPYGNGKLTVGEIGGLHDSYADIVIKYYVIPQVTMGVYATKGLHEKLHFSIMPELLDCFINDASSKGIEVEFLSPMGHHNDDNIELWTPEDKDWEVVEETFNELDWENNVKVLENERNERNNHQETGGTNTQNLATRKTSCYIAFPALKKATTENNMVPDMVRMSKIGIATGWIKTPAEREAQPERREREKTRTLLFLKTIHPDCYIEAMSDTATRTGFNHIVAHTDDHNGRWDEHTYVVVCFVHVVIDPLGENPMHTRFAKVAYSRKSAEDFMHRYYCVQESSRDMTKYLDFLKENDPGRLFYDEELIKAGKLEAREMAAYCFYYRLPNVDKRMFLSAFIDAIHKLAEFFQLSFEAIIDISYCIGWCTEPSKFVSVLDRWMAEKKIPTHQMLCLSAIEIGKEMYGNMNSGKFNRCGVFATHPLDRTLLIKEHANICSLIQEAGEMHNGEYKVKWDYESFVKRLSEKVSNIGGFSGQHWVQCLVTLMVLKRPEWSREAFVTNTTKNYSRLMKRLSVSNPETVKNIFESVSLKTGYSRFIVENIYCEMYKEYTGAHASRARDCYYWGSRFYKMEYKASTNEYKASYIAFGSEQDPIQVGHDWWTHYSNSEMCEDSKNLSKLYSQWQIKFNKNPEEKFPGKKLYFGGKNKDGLSTMLDVLVEFENADGSRSSDHMLTTKWLLESTPQYEGGHVFPDFMCLSAAGKQACTLEECYKRTPAKEGQFPLPKKRTFEEVMVLLAAEAAEFEISEGGHIGTANLPVTKFKPAHCLTDDQWTACGLKM